MFWWNKNDERLNEFVFKWNCWTKNKYGKIVI